MENNQEKKVGDKDEALASPSFSVDDIQHLASSSSISTMENNHEKKVGDKDKDEAEASLSFSVDDIQHSLPSS
eukprot:13712243-Ditylum_brightwellii.AAC.1